MKYEEPYLTPEFKRRERIDEKKRKGLVELYIKSHPGVSPPIVKDAIEDFKRKGREQQSFYRENWERGYTSETGRCSTGASPIFERAPPGGILHDIRKVKPPEEVKIVTRTPKGILMPREDLEFIIREQAKEIQELKAEMQKLKTEMQKLMERK